MRKRVRFYINIYFDDGLVGTRKKRDLTLAFAAGDDLYEKCKGLGSSRIKEITGISSFSQLVEQARKEDRSPGGLLKHRLKIYLDQEQADTAC